MKCKECGATGTYHFSNCSIGQELYEDENDEFQEEIRHNQVKTKKNNINRQNKER